MRYQSFIFAFLVPLFCAALLSACTSHESNAQALEQETITDEPPAAEAAPVQYNAPAFSVVFPYDGASARTDMYYLGGDTIRVNIAELTASHEDEINLLYRADHTYMPHIKKLEQIDSLFQAQWGYIASLDQVEVLNFGALQDQAWPGMMGTLGVEGGDVFTSYRMHFVRGTFCKLMVITGVENHPNEIASEFLNSFTPQ